MDSAHSYQTARHHIQEQNDLTVITVRTSPAFCLYLFAKLPLKERLKQISIFFEEPSAGSDMKLQS
jgi:hypothetical protein